MQVFWLLPHTAFSSGPIILVKRPGVHPCWAPPNYNTQFACTTHPLPIAYGWKTNAENRCLLSASWAEALVSPYRNVVTGSQWSGCCCGLALRTVGPGSDSYGTTSFAGLDETHSELHKDRLRQRTTGVMSQQVLQQVIPIPQLAITLPRA